MVTPAPCDVPTLTADESPISVMALPLVADDVIVPPFK